MMRDMPVSLFHGIDETQRDLIAGLLEVMIHGLQEIQVRAGTPDDGLGAHLLVRRRTWSRRPSK